MNLFNDTFFIILCGFFLSYRQTVKLNHLYLMRISKYYKSNKDFVYSVFGLIYQIKCYKNSNYKHSQREQDQRDIAFTQKLEVRISKIIFYLIISNFTLDIEQVIKLFSPSSEITAQSQFQNTNQFVTICFII
ncbi:hypothetical protein pb186bvf_014252 [Paramecium bursaria]